RVDRAAGHDGLAGGRAGLFARDPRACRRIRRGTAAAAPAAAVALPAGLGRGLPRPFDPGNTAFDIRLEQPVQVDDHIFELGIVYAALRLASPSLLGRGIAVVNADEVDVLEVGEDVYARALDAPAEAQAQLSPRE